MTDDLKIEHVFSTAHNFTRVTYYSLAVYPETTFFCDPGRQEENIE